MDSDMRFVIGFAVVWLVMYLLMFGLGLANYIMTSWGLYSIADRRQISNPWLAWLPIGNYWIIGSIADEYDGRNGIKRKWRMVLLILELLLIAFVFVFIIMFILSMASIFAVSFEMEYAEPDFGQMLGAVLPMYLGMIFMILVASALQICGMICMYKIFESTVPDKSVKYMLLSILVPLASAICLMLCRKKGYSNPKPVKTAAAVQLPDVAEAPEVEEISVNVVDAEAADVEEIPSDMAGAPSEEE